VPLQGALCGCRETTVSAPPTGRYVAGMQIWDFGLKLIAGHVGLRIVRRSPTRVTELNDRL